MIFPSKILHTSNHVIGWFTFWNERFQNINYISFVDFQWLGCLKFVEWSIFSFFRVNLKSHQKEWKKNRWGEGGWFCDIFSLVTDYFRFSTWRNKNLVCCDKTQRRSFKICLNRIVFDIYILTKTYFNLVHILSDIRCT